jgi:hypothetical protein
VINRFQIVPRRRTAVLAPALYVVDADDKTTLPILDDQVLEFRPTRPWPLEAERSQGNAGPAESLQEILELKLIDPPSDRPRNTRQPGRGEQIPCVDEKPLSHSRLRVVQGIHRTCSGIGRLRSQRSHRVGPSHKRLHNGRVRA